jgi:xanthine dehydrogenase accessory factor
MKEIKDIVAAFDQAEQEGKQTALATVVNLEGSAYRRPGARMLVTEDGKLTGAISGGCLEGDALRKAQLVMVQKKPMLVTYDTTDDDDAKLGVGLGCNGIISILIEPVNTADQNNPIAYLKEILSKRQTAVIVTMFSLDKKAAQPGTCMLLAEHGDLKSNLTSQHLRAPVEADTRRVLTTRTSLTKVYVEETLLTGFIELVEPPVSLLVFGAGNDTIPLVEMAHVLGWETTIVDGRPAYATRQRFPLATRLLISKPDAAFSQLAFDERTVAVLMTHNYLYDLAALKNLLPLPVPYIGALGPKKKLERMFDELKEEGGFDSDTNKVFGPAGLDVGAETAEEIALSILSEIKAVLSTRSGSSLRNREDTIHPRGTQQVLHFENDASK